MDQKWIAPIVIALLGVAGVGAYVASPRVEHADSTQARTSAEPAAFHAGTGTGAIACVASPTAGSSHATLNAHYLSARNLLADKQFEAALPGLQEIATADPGFPGIHLDIANALLQTKHAEEARTAVNAQIAISECLGKLPAEALDDYCSTEFDHASVHGCRPQLSYIQHAAQLQSAVVALELGRPGEAEPAVTADAKPLGPVHPDLVVVASAKPKKPAAPPHAEPKPGGDRTLVDGAGTDSDLGAYSKP